MPSDRQETTPVAATSGRATATFHTLATFDGSDGTGPFGLTFDTDGNILGLTRSTGPGNRGNVFELAKTATGYAAAPTTLTTFKGGAGGAEPEALVVGRGGNLFGVTYLGGANKLGTVFELRKTASGYATKPEVLISFKEHGGYHPVSLITDAMGDLFGIARTGHTYRGYHGTVFELASTAAGYSSKQTVLTGFERFESSEPTSNLIMDSRGDLFGSTSFGGGSNVGQVYEIPKTTGGYRTPKVVYDGPVASLTLDSRGNLFGLTKNRATGNGSIIELTRTATGYKRDPVTLARFDGSIGQPSALIQDTSGNLYGVALQRNGSSGTGTVFELAKTATGYSSKLTTIASFETGLNPIVSLRAGPDGNLYGTTSYVDSGSQGSVFEIALAGGSAATVAAKAAAAPAAVCFVAGTRILTSTGEVAVEALAVGDLVLTASGKARTVRWLGHRTVDCRRHPRRQEVMPIRINAHAFGPNRPARDLCLSPGHAVCVDAMGEVLVPVASLVDGTAIVRSDVETVTYWHVELDSHDIILAEGLPCESYLEMGNRRFFSEESVVALAAGPDLPAYTHADFCRPFNASGPRVEAIRRFLVARARIKCAQLDPNIRVLARERLAIKES